MKKTIKKAQDITVAGWGVDIDNENDPTYPMKTYTGDDHNRTRYHRPFQQPVDVEVLHSNERPNVSAVFGTPLPPTGLSGAIRRFAFKHSESSLVHWLPLLIADRVNVVEGIIEDISQGHIPNIWAEKGYKAQWKYQRGKLIGKVLAQTAVLAGVAALVVLAKRKGRA
jgi:hypothetical protein